MPIALATLLFVVALGTSTLRSQSTSQEFPTPVTSNEISGTIRARDIGDSRLTTYYYAFDTSIGDLFVNISTRNFSGDIDVYTAAGLRPLTKIVVFADTAESETGRVLYFRKNERVLLRIQGRTPGDDAASFRIKFAGSFVALSRSELPEEPEIPKVSSQADSGIRVNSVGTILPNARRIIPTVAERRAEIAEVEPKADDPVDNRPSPTSAPEPEKLSVVVTETGTATSPAVTTATPRRSRTTSRSGARRTRPAPRAWRVPRTTEPPATATPAEIRVNRLARINLVIEFKDGRRIERPINEVIRFTVDRGMLTVVSRDGRIGRYSLLDILKTTIE
ncbi:MAG: hypothetical protein LC734_07565 [Acidobacteria bacterium]|nr:hypothetical protein [Acidobacteriota bacterium]